MKTIHFDHLNVAYHVEIDDYGDSESSDTVTIFGPDGAEISSYDSCARTDEQFISEATREIEAGRQP